jgi:hypothetical protein
MTPFLVLGEDWVMRFGSEVPKALELVQGCKNILHMQAQLFTFFSNSTHKTETGAANRWGQALPIANHLDQSL